jgi:hypothetical protein
MTAGRQVHVSPRSQANSTPPVRSKDVDRDTQPFEEFANVPVSAALLPGRVRAGQTRVSSSPALPAPRKQVRISAIPGQDFDWFDQEHFVPDDLYGRGAPAVELERPAFAERDVNSLLSNDDDEESSMRVGGQSQFVCDDATVADEASADNRDPTAAAAATVTAPSQSSPAPLPVRRRSQPMLSNPLDSDGEPVVDEDSESEYLAPIRTQEEANIDRDEEWSEDAFCDDNVVGAAKSAKGGPVVVAKAHGGLSQTQAITPKNSSQAKSAAISAKILSQTVSPAIKPKSSSQTKSQAITPSKSTSQTKSSIVGKSPQVIAYEEAVAEAAQARARVSLAAAAAGIVDRPAAAAASDLPQLAARYESLVEERLLNAALSHAQLDASVVGLTKTTLSGWLGTREVRNLILLEPRLWQSGLQRTRAPASERTRSNYISVARGVLQLIGAGSNDDAMTIVSTSEQLRHVAPREILRAFATARPSDEWQQLVASARSPSSTHQAGQFMVRLLCWAIDCEHDRPQQERVQELALCLPLKAVVELLTQAACRQHRIEVIARRSQVNFRTSEFQQLAVTLREVATFKINCHSAIGQLDLRHAPLIVKEGAVILALIGMFDIPAARIGIAKSGAADVAHCPSDVNPNDLTLVRYNRDMLMLHVGANARQKGHVMAPFQVRAPLAERVFNELLSDALFVHGGPMVVLRDMSSLQVRMLDISARLGLVVPEVLHRDGGGIGEPDQMQRSSCRRLWISLGLLLVLWRVLDPLHFVALCYAQLHEPRTAASQYNMFGGLFVLLGNAANDCEAAIVDKYNEVMSLTNDGVVSGETHNMLISALWHARDAIVRACELLSHPTEFTCPKCDQRGPIAGLGDHMSLCLVENVGHFTARRLHKQEMRVQLGGLRRTPIKVTGPNMRLGGSLPKN